jgi:hypothetical protein
LLEKIIYGTIASLDTNEYILSIDPRNLIFFLAWLSESMEEACHKASAVALCNPS